MSIERLRRRIEELCGTLSLPGPHGSYLETSPQWDGAKHVELKGSTYHYVDGERGVEYGRRTTDSEDEIAYWIMKDITFRIACQKELENRRPQEDFRRQLFQIQEDLLHNLNVDWGEACRRDHEELLKGSPFNDHT